MREIFTFQRQVSQRLLLWSVFSVVSGAWLMRKDSADRRGFGQQAVAWGVIDAAIALGGWFASQRRSRNADAQDAAVQRKETHNLRRLLWINAGLDVLYMIGGAWWARRPDPQRRGWAGHGWGVVAQGAFLFAFDLIHALLLNDPQPAAEEDRPL
ncbi:MAG: hypothetical protein R2856_09675 [Caldilineaceae bacterium]|nr:hypothetical protein [Caldilineaceae bacterium]